MVFSADRGLIPGKGSLMVVTRSRIKQCSWLVVMWSMAACVPNEAPSPEATQPTTSAAPKPQVVPGATNFRSVPPRPPTVRPIPLGEGVALAPAHESSPPPPVASGSAPKKPGAKATPAAPAAESAVGKGGVIKSAFVDSFDRLELGPDWNLTSPVWKIVGGQLCGEGARNHPAWLTRRLPTNARIEFETLSRSPDGDLKVELWGDGKSFAKATSYSDATSYIAIFGGWHNQFHVLARIDEHAKDRPEILSLIHI